MMIIIIETNNVVIGQEIDMHRPIESL
jgi:hypothetical protein